MDPAGVNTVRGSGWILGKRKRATPDPLRRPSVSNNRRKLERNGAR